jgi:hypothetical protein
VVRVPLSRRARILSNQKVTRWIALGIVTLLTACALTPNEIVQQGTRRTAALQLPPIQAAACIQRNAEERSAYYIATQRPRPDNSLEVVIRLTQLLGVLAVARLHAEGTGSAAELWMSPNVLVDAESLTRKFMQGC